MEIIRKGSKRSIYHADENTTASFNESLERIPAGTRRIRVKQRMKARLELLADGKIDEFIKDYRTEGNLPRGGKFKGVVADRIRAYGWNSKRYPGRFIISHYKFKDQQKLDPADTRRVGECWKYIEEGP